MKAPAVEPMHAENPASSMPARSARNAHQRRTRDAAGSNGQTSDGKHPREPPRGVQIGSSLIKTKNKDDFTIMVPIDDRGTRRGMRKRSAAVHYHGRAHAGAAMNAPCAVKGNRNPTIGRWTSIAARVVVPRDVNRQPTASRTTIPPPVHTEDSGRSTSCRPAQHRLEHSEPPAARSGRLVDPEFSAPGSATIVPEQAKGT